MAHHCNHNDSGSQYPPVCCVHNTESQPLLGHHAHSQYQQQQHAVPPPEYCIDMNGGDSKGAYYASAPAHHQHHQCTRLHDGDCHQSRTRISKFLRFLFFFAFITLAYNSIIRMFFFGPDHHNHGGHWNANDSKLDELANDSGNLSFDRCRDNAIDWDGPSTFTTEVKNFHLKIGQGNIVSHVKISTGPVALPTLHILGEVSPYDDEDDTKLNRKEIKPSAAHDGKIYIDHLGLHVAIIEEDNQFDAQVWYDNREVVDPRDKQHYRACARLVLEIVLPESFTQYGSISVDGPVVAIDALGLENVKFDRLHFGSSVGEISTHGRIQTDVLDAKSNTGRIRADSVQVATTGKPLDIQVTTITGNVHVTAETTDIDAAEENTHKVHLATNTGRIDLTVQPSTTTPSSSVDSKHGHLDISTVAKTGSIDSTITLASQGQILVLKSETNTGSIRTHISDEFLGHFGLATKWGSTRVEPAKGSKSIFTYEKLNAREKIGTKTLERGGDEYKGSIEISTKTGSTSLEFTN